MLTALFPAIMALIGLALYFVSANPKVQEVGKILFAAGAIALAFQLGGKSISL